MTNEYLLDYIGKSNTPNLMKDVNNFLAEQKAKLMRDSYEKYGSVQKEYVSENAVVCVMPKESKEILSLGGSIPRDLVLTNLGQLWAGIESFTQANSDRNMVSLDGVTRLMRMNDNRANRTGALLVPEAGGADRVGAKIKIGKGSGAVDRSNFNITTPFTTSPEDDFIFPSEGGWDPVNGLVVNQGAIVAGGTGVISECSLVMNLFRAFSPDFGAFEFLMTRDLVSPGAAFGLGQSILVTYTWTLT